MPCYLFTFHAYGTWMPDRKTGYVRRKQGLLPPDHEQARDYRQRAIEDTATFDHATQRLLIEETRTAGAKQQFRVHYISSDPTHIHILVSWPDDRPWLKVRTGIKASLARRLNREVQERSNWFVDGASRRQVTDDDHFGHLVNNYLPSHRGWKWCEGGGMFV